jgi:hypothetical protein
VDTEQNSAQEPATPATLTEAQSAQIMARYRLEQQVLSGAGQFYWIAGLSLVNSVLYLLNTGWVFFIGLAATQLIDGIASAIAADIGEAGIVIRIIGLILDLFVAGMFVFFGVFARRRHMWAFVVGLVIYALDGLLLLLVGDWLGVALHGLFLYLIFGGVRALRRLNAIESGASIPLVALPKPPPTVRDRKYWARLLAAPAALMILLVILLVAIFMMGR